MPTSITTISSPRPCAPFSGGPPLRTRRPRSPATSSGQGGCGRPLDRVAGWLGGGIAVAFFASLERCSCVNVRTHDDLDDGQSDSEAPLMSDVDGDAKAAASAAGTRRRRTWRGGSTRNEKGMRSGGGKGCYAV